MSNSSFSESALRVLEQVLLMPLASALDMASVQRRDATAVHAGLRELQEAGLVQPVSLGCLKPQVRRFHLTELGQSELKLTGAIWHQPGCLGRLPSMLGFSHTALPIPAWRCGSSSRAFSRSGQSALVISQNRHSMGLGTRLADVSAASRRIKLPRWVFQPPPELQELTGVQQRTPRPIPLPPKT